MKILFFQKQREIYYSSHIIFDIIRKNLPGNIGQKLLLFTNLGLSHIAKIKQIYSVAHQEKGVINHVIEEIN